ncbi:hypothetical protein BGX23_003528 [Mortierella sp. AD031]|nr:hypothetical protein BGX23_003528 [Mortierella sp. AD031]
MLPVIGVETRAVIRTKAVETMQQIVGDSGSSSRGGGGGGRLTHYESILRVIRTAVGDAGLLTPTPSSSSSSSSQSWLISNVATTGARNANNRHSRTTMDDLMVLADDGRNEQVSEYDDVGDISNINNNINSSSNSNGGGGGDSEIDESQIPVIADIAMEAVLDYMAEILTPSLVIHQMTEAIQDALFEISKQRTTLQRARNQRGISNDGGDKDDNSSDLEDLNDGDFDLNDFSSSSSSSRSSQSAGTATKAADRHGVDLLSDGWVWSEPSSSRDRNSLLSLEDDYYGEEDEGRGQDEDLWGKDMEIHQWDSAGRLFEDFEENDILDDNMADEFSTSFQTVMSKTKQEDMENWDVPAAAAGDDEDDEDSDPYTIGIWESDEGGRGDSEDAEEDNETTTVTSGGSSSEEYGRGREASPRQSYFNRFQKRALFTPDNTAASTSVESNSATPQSSSAKPIDNNAKAAATTTTTSPIRNTIRRPNITPDLRLENLLTQLIEPLLTTFIEEDFPASCKRVQGELMDGIIWSLDQTELNSDGLNSDEERMLLLSELEY